MMSLSGWGYCYLAGAKEDDRWSYTPITIQSRYQPGYSDTPEMLMKLHPALHRHMSNKVKVCPNCGKSCGFTLNACNNCATDISSQPLTRTNNALMGFVYGLRAFPTSIRFENETNLVYDDLMQTTLIHLNSIPTTIYIPDFRYLFSDPKKGLQLIDEMFDAATRAAVDMLSNEGFRKKLFSPFANKIMEKEGLERFVRQNVLCGCNYPPSQCQLHLQFILPPYVPYHAVLLAEGKHSDMERFFIFDYIRECLEIMIERGNRVPIGDIEHLTGRELISTLRKMLGTDYYKSFYDAMKQHKENDKRFANWKKEDFEYIVVDKKVVLPVNVMNGDPSGQTDTKASDLLKRDKKTISSFGKGLGLQYYTHFKQPGEVRDWVAA